MATKKAATKKKPAKKAEPKLKAASTYKKALEDTLKVAEKQGLTKGMCETGRRVVRLANKVLDRDGGDKVDKTYTVAVRIKDFVLDGDADDSDSYRVTVTDAVTSKVLVDKAKPAYVQYYSG